MIEGRCTGRAHGVASAGRNRGTDLSWEDDASAPRDPSQLSPEQIRATLERHEGNQSRAYRELGLSSRHALYRLIKRYGIEVPQAD